MEVVDDKSKIIIDMIMCQSPFTTDKINKNDAMDNYMRRREIREYYHSVNDIIEFKKGEPHIQYRYLSYPEKPLSIGIHALNFDSSFTQPLIEQGIKDG